MPFLRLAVLKVSKFLPKLGIQELENWELRIILYGGIRKNWSRDDLSTPPPPDSSL
jgi:hypothetical protein